MFSPMFSSPADMFDVKICQRKLSEHYEKSAKVPTTAWSSVLQVDLEQIYTRLSWVKQEQTTAGSSQKELSHYTEIFTEKAKNGDVAKRILVQGETGIGKTTFVKKLLVDWSNLEEAEMDEECKDALRKFDLVVSINLKEVSKCQTLKEVVSGSRLLPEDDEKSVDDLLCYMRTNQDKVLLVFDGYDEYRTGSEAEERYGSRSNSPIFKIFHGNILRDCTVLVTSRSSRADEIRGPVDIQAEITGFNIFEREDFMRKMLDSQTEVDDLLTFLCTSGMQDLARVPLLSLFFCLLWKEEKQKLVELTERKAKLYQAIVKHILRHSHRRHSSSKASKLNEAYYEEILAEVGKVALAGLLKGDLVFEFGQLPEKVRGEEGIIVGLFQFSEYGPSLEPMEMVSFIHKSIQEYLAAWYLVSSCVPKGDLGEIEQHGATLEDCEALENVFQFVSGLSEEGAIKVLEHLKSVRISDPTLDLSNTIPNVEAETGAPLCDITNRHERFSYLVYDYFRGVQSKAELLNHFLDCTGGVVLVTRYMLLSELIPDVNVLKKLARNLVFIPWEIFFYFNGEDSIAYKLLAFLDCLQLPVRITESSDVLEVEVLVRKLQPIRFRSILCLRNGQFQFYITKLSLERDDHARPFTESTSISAPPDTGSLCLQQSCLKFLTFLYYRNLSDQTVKALGAVIRSCEHLDMIDAVGGEESMCYLLEQVRNPNKCSVAIATCFIHPDVTVDPAPEGAVQLASLLPRFNSIITLHLDVRDCCAGALNTLINGITHKAVENLILSGIKLTPATAVALGQSLPEMSSLQVLQFYGRDGSILQAEEMKVLFGGFNKTLPLCNLTFSSFSEISCLAQFNESFHFFPNLRGLHLEKLNLNEHDLCGLLESWSFIRNLTELHVRGNQPGRVHFSTRGIEKSLILGGVKLTSTVAMTLGRVLPEMPSLQVLQLYEMVGSSLQAEEMKALFGRFKKMSPLCKLTFNGFSEISCLAPFNESLHFFPNLRELHLETLNLNEHDLCGLLESWSFIRNLTELHVLGNQPGRVYSYTSGISAELILGGVNLTSPLATTLGRILPEMSSLQVLKLTDVGGSVLQTRELEALFGKLHTSLPLHQLDISGYNMTGSLAPLIRSLRFFPNVRQLGPYKLNMDEDGQCGVMESLKFIPHLTSMTVESNPLLHEDCSTPRLTLTSRISGLGTSKSLNLRGLSLTPATAASLGRSLPEMSSLETLELNGLQDLSKQTEALFGGFKKILPLSDLPTAPLTNSFCVPNLVRLCLEGLSMDEHNLCGLLESLQAIPKLMELEVYDRGVSRAHCSTPKAKPGSGFTHEALRKLELIGIDLTPAVAGVLGRLLPEMLSLQKLRLQGLWLPLLKDEGLEALFGGFYKRVPLVELYLSARGCPFYPAAKRFRFFPDLEHLYLEEFIMDEPNLCALLESLSFIPNLKELYVKDQPLGFAQFFPMKVDTLPSIIHNTPEQVKLDEVSQSPVTAALLSQSLPEVSSQETVKLTGVDGSIFQPEEMEPSFGAFIPNLKKPNSKVEVNAMASITHKTLEQLKLDGVSLTPVTATLLGRLLPEMSSLETLELTGVDGSILQAEEMEALFGGFNKTLALHWVTLKNFSVRGCLATFCKGFHAFPNLKTLKLERLSWSERAQCSLLESLRFIVSVRELSVESIRHDQGDAHRYSIWDRIDSSFKLEAHERLHLVGINLTQAAAAALGRSLPEMSSLQVLQLTGEYTSILQAEDIKALFGGFNKTLPLSELTLSGFSVRGCLSPLIKSLHFLPSLKELKLENLAIDEHDQCDLLKSLGFFRNLTTLSVHFSGEKCLDSSHCYTSGLTTVVSHADDRIGLYGINLTPAVAAVLGQLLCEMLFLQDLQLTGLRGSILGAEEMEALFGGFNKTMPLCTLIFRDFSVTGSFTPLYRSFRFFPSLKVLDLSMLNMDEHDLRGLLESFQFIPNLQLLNLSDNPIGDAVTSIVPHVVNLKKLQCLLIDVPGLSEEDLIYVRDTVKQALPGIQVKETCSWIIYAT